MKRQNKKSQQPLRTRLFGTPKRFLVTGMVAVVVFGIAYFSIASAFYSYYNYKTATDLAQTESMRQLLIRSVDQLRSAPVDGRSGDVYFPESRLYLPRPADPVSFAYAAYPSVQADELSVINRSIVERPIGQLAAANNLKQIYAIVPKLQACARGVVLSYKPQSATLPTGKLIQVISLPNDRRLYAFIDSGCEENAMTVKLLHGLRPY
jgi:hypothetical protein